MKSSKISFRKLNEYDWDVIEEAFNAEGWNSSVEDYQKCFEAMKQGICEIIIAQWLEEFAGAAVIRWKSEHTALREADIPEIIDLRVLFRYSRSGVYNELMNEVEKKIFSQSDFAAIGMPLTAEFGHLQILCLKRGYIPDGRGIFRDYKPVETGEQVTIDEHVKLFMLKDCDRKTAYKKGAVKKLENFYFNIYKGKL